MSSLGYHFQPILGFHHTTFVIKVLFSTHFGLTIFKPILSFRYHFQPILGFQHITFVTWVPFSPMLALHHTHFVTQVPFSTHFGAQAGFSSHEEQLFEKIGISV